MKCPNCEAENPDYAFYCGKCAKELRPSSPPPRARPIEVEQANAVTTRNETLSSGVFVLVEIQFNGTSSSLIVNNDTTTQNSNDLNQTKDGGTVGARASNNWYGASIVEVAIYSTQITGTDLQGLRTYFQNKFLLSDWAPA